MRTNIEIDDNLMQEILRTTGLKTKREAVDLGLRTLLRLRRQADFRKYRGKLNWEGDLDKMRIDK
jgi:Arc/MetJ family transcription regulator